MLNMDGAHFFLHRKPEGKHRRQIEAMKEGGKYENG
jgi:hypothetical protein